MLSHQLLAGKRGIVFGVVDERSLAWAVASQCVEEGAQIVLTNTESAFHIGTVEQLAREANIPLIPCDATDVSDIENLFHQTTQLLGGKVDFILHAVAMSNNIRRRRHYDDLSYNYMLSTLDVSAVSLHKILQTGVQVDAINVGASVVSLTYIGAERSIEGYNDMGDAKALLESITRNLGRVFGERMQIRVNTLSQSPTPTRAGNKFMGIDYFQDFASQIAPLGNADAKSCADVCVMLFSDYTRHITMQNIFNDGGFSSTGISKRYVEQQRSYFEYCSNPT